ncbi:hypothetical protein [Aurantibacillus circumpalustris]|uniref:hypothetical protein n=1 Tax=Aurantibacillus circumpalustris TaxID=3036359 RepID=UPI00295AAB5F|nr:hypothetical protein [Aurantibacillus circumpalustris]
MSNKTISNHIELKDRISYLISERKKCEEKLLINLKDTVDTVIHPTTIIKQSAHDLAASKDFRADVLKIGINLASSYLIGKLANTLVGSVLKKITNKNSNEKSKGLLGFIGNLVSGKKDKQGGFLSKAVPSPIH